MLGFPWYAGPSIHTYPRYHEITHYFGRLQERCEWLNYVGEKYGPEAQKSALVDLPALNRDGQYPESEITLEDDVLFEFGQNNQGDLSLVGLARELIVESALQWGADWLLMWDNDMMMDWDFMLKLWRHQKPVVAALAFASREPCVPVIYKIQERNGVDGVQYHSQQVLDFPRDRLISSKDIGGKLAFGTGVVLINMSVFKQLPKPWFYSTMCGEDFMFCVNCHQNGIPLYVDTSTKTHHPARNPIWMNESYYDETRKAHPERYEKYKVDNVS